MDPRMLTAIRSLLDNAPLFPRCEVPLYGKLCGETTVEFVLQDRLDCDHAESFIVDLRTDEPVGPAHNALTWPPPDDAGYVDLTLLLERVEDDGGD